ncbi:uncharacterized protein LOC123539527 [Mercenaria mercenaria]|uniref:uncharacterized protein LOC123539527 n=1 Tax=Mercenaria mercenaria TaxID=6596 RepID=UPI00234E5D47|nr:uncharacterized protein LOC123539527 [Mercenaria mercenaria]
MVTECCASLLNAQRHCKLKHTFNLDLPEIHPQTLNSFAQRSYTNSSRWGIIQDENEFLHESEDLSVRCLLLGENGKLWTDNCNERHRTLCIRDTTHAVFQYVGQSKIPRYTESTTKRQTSDLISNTEFTTVTVSIGEDTVPAKPDVASTGVSIAVVIIVCISAVVLIILAVVLVILIMKKRSMIQETHHRRVKYVAEQTNDITPTNNKAGDAYESVDERQDKEHSSGSPNTKGSAYKSLVERHNVEHSYRTLNTQRSRFELLDGTPNTQRMLMSHWMKDKMRNTALEHRPLQHVDSISH